MDLPFSNASACRVMGICSALSFHNYQCHTFGYSKSSTSSGIADGITYENEKYPKKLTGYFKTFGRKKRIKNILLRFNPREIKAIFFTSIGHIQLKYIGKWCKKNKVPLIYDCGDRIRGSSKGALFNFISRIEKRKYESTVKKYASVMCISNYLYNCYKNKVFHAFIVPCICSPKSERFNISESTFVDFSKINIGYFGDPGKGFNKDRLDWCVNSFAKIYNKQQAFYIASNSQEIKNFDIDGVTILGKIPNKDCVSLIKSLDFVVFFRENNETTKAGFPSKVTESFACGTPVLTNITSDLGDYLNENNSLFIDGFSEEDCDRLFVQLSNIKKEKVSFMRKYLKVNNRLDSALWGNKIIKELDYIYKELTR